MEPVYTKMVTGMHLRHRLQCTQRAFRRLCGCSVKIELSEADILCGCQLCSGIINFIIII